MVEEKINERLGQLSPELKKSINDNFRTGIQNTNDGLAQNMSSNQQRQQMFQGQQYQQQNQQMWNQPFYWNKQQQQQQNF